MRALFIVLISLNAFSQSDRESVALKHTKSNSFYKDETDLMPGNNDYGFFIKEISPERANCRFKAKVYCDFGLGSVKLIKHKAFVLDFFGMTFSSSTNDLGEFDLLLKCDPSFKKKSVIFKMDEYQFPVQVLKFPKKIELSASECKLIK